MSVADTTAPPQALGPRSPELPPSALPGGFAPVLLLLAAIGLGGAAQAAAYGPLAQVLESLAVLAVAGLFVIRPGLGALTLIAATGFMGTLLAYTPISTTRLVDLVLIALWVGVLARLLSGRRTPVWLWPGLLPLTLFMLVTTIEIPLAERFQVGVDGFRLSAWYLSAFLLVAVAAWSPDTRTVVAKAAIVVAIAVTAYAALRWIVGPTAAEADFARFTRPDLTNLRLFGSFPSANHLALWSATTAPFALGIAIVSRGRWRGLAGLALLGCVFAVIASEVRTGVLAIVVGLAVTLLLFQLARAFPGGTRLGTAFLVTLVIGALAVGSYMVAIESSSESSARYSRILTPGEDPTYQARLSRWDDALDEMSDRPFGRGLGSIGAESTRFIDPSLTLSVDSSFLRIGLEQGILVMALLAFGLIALMASLALRAMHSRDPDRAALGVAACGVLATLAVFFYGGSYVTMPQAVSAWLLVGLGVAAFTSPAPPFARSLGRVASERRNPAAEAA